MTEQNELPPEIIRDDIEVLREEQDRLYDDYLRANAAIQKEINIRVSAARVRGIEV